MRMLFFWPESAKRRRLARGFSLLEMLFATLILLVGLVGVAQLVPASILLDQKSRLNSGALVFAQRELEQMIEQPISLQPATFTDSIGNLCDLGDSSQPGIVVGSPVVVINNQPMIDFTASAVAGYSFTYWDPDDPYQVTYDVRWAVVTYVQGTTIFRKRFILGVRQSGGPTYIPPVTLDTMVEK
jgi:prepilin-type N-terminal cleavage/methylation domain-containing protein